MFDQPCWIKRPTGFDAVDSAFGQRTGLQKTDPIYEGLCRIQKNSKTIARSGSGDEKEVSDASIFLPKGVWDIKENDYITVGERLQWVGKIRDISAHTEKFYTRIEVIWDGTGI
tara:strand:- start:1088 stop:1429 length:342 start_codon:yes stop_codon:yes gene_type:complete